MNEQASILKWYYVEKNWIGFMEVQYLFLETQLKIHSLEMFKDKNNLALQSYS